MKIYDNFISKQEALILKKYIVDTEEELGSTERGAGGFGSSGK